MNQTQLVSLFFKNPIPPEREYRRPSNMFEDELDEWQRQRGHDLYDKPDGAYAYFISDLKGKMAATDALFARSEETRAAIRAGADPSNVLIDADNVPPGRYLEMTATWFGWRLVPLIRKYAGELGDPGWAKEFECRIDTWLAKADALWEALETMPNGAKTRESFAPWVDPLRLEAKRICDNVLRWIGVIA